MTRLLHFIRLRRRWLASSHLRWVPGTIPQAVIPYFPSVTHLQFFPVVACPINMAGCAWIEKQVAVSDNIELSSEVASSLFIIFLPTCRPIAQIVTALTRLSARMLFTLFFLVFSFQFLSISLLFLLQFHAARHEFESNYD